MPRSAEVLHREGVELANRGRYADARRRLSQAAGLTDDPDLRGRIAGTHAYALARMGEVAEAMRICSAALEDPRLGAHTVAILAGQMGALAEQAGEFDEAERWLTRGIAGLSDDAEAHATLLVNRSLINMRRRALAAAAQDASAATAIYAGLGMEVAEAQARHNEGYVALLGGDLIDANQSMLAARATLAPLSPVSAAICDADRAEVLRDAGLTTEAEDILRRTAPIFGAHRMPQYRGEAEYHLACSLLTHDAAQARKVAAAAARRFRSLGNAAWAARADGVRLRAELAGSHITRSGTRVAGSRRPPSPGEVDAAATDLEERGLGSEAAALRMTLVLARARQTGAIERSAIRVPRTASMEVRLLAHEARASVAAAAGRLAEARRHAAAGLDVLARWQESFGSLDLQTALAMHSNGLMFAGLDSAIRSRRPDIVFEWSERARHLSHQVIPLRPSPDPAIAAEMAEIRMLRADDPAWLSNPRIIELRERARGRQWSGTRAGGIEQRATLAEVQSALGADTSLISFVFSGDALSALVVTRDGAWLRPIPGWARVREAFTGLRADLDMSATIRGPMSDIVRRSLGSRLAAMSEALVDDAVDLAGTRRLVLTVPGVLSGVPWAMLPGMQGRVFTLAASATRWLRVPRGGAVVSRVGLAAGPRVARAHEEVHGAASVWNGTGTALNCDTSATVARVTEMASTVDVLHIAAHGRHSADNPMFSGLELADGTLFGYDIDLIERVPDTVVLSACEVGRSSVRWGEEAVGMTRVWLHAGARAVVAAPVVVADDDACELLSAMHEGLAAGHAPSVALAEASRRTGIVAPFQVHGAGF